VGQVYVCVHQFQCAHCQFSNLGRRLISAESLEEANRKVRENVTACAVCTRKLTVSTQVTIDVREALPEDIINPEDDPAKTTSKTSFP
jgi:hypothetical protein